jgi:hypothetical protein
VVLKVERKALSLLEEYEENAEWFREKYKELVETYDGMFVAIHKKRIVDYDKDLDPLVDRVSGKYPLNRTFIDFVTKEKLVLIL